MPKRIVHAYCSLSSAGVAMVYPNVDHSDTPPSPPLSPTHPRISTVRYNAVAAHSSSATSSFMRHMWPASWHVIRDIATDQHDIVSLHPSAVYHQGIQCMTQVFDPLFANALPHSKAVVGWDTYILLLNDYADAMVTKSSSDKDIYWIHDYQLIMLPRVLRARHANARIVLSLYTEFPAAIESLHVCNDILESILAADAITFQTAHGMALFQTLCQKRFPKAIWPTWMKTLTVPARLHSLPWPHQHVSLATDHGKKRIVFCSAANDRYLLAGIDQLLSEKVWTNQVLFLLFARQRSSAPRTTVDAINQRYGEAILCYAPSDNATEVALLVSDIALVLDTRVPSAVRHVLTHRKSHALIVATHSTWVNNDAVQRIPARNPKVIARALHDTLSSLPAQATPPPAPSVLPDTTATITPSELLRQLAMPRLLQPTRLSQAFHSARRRLLLLDYDGTLTPIVANPSDARPTPTLLAHLQRLCDHPANAVWIVSGRDQATLDKWLGSVRGLGLSAEHGSFMRPPGQAWRDLLATANMDWKHKAHRIFQHITTDTPGTVIEQKKSSITWHYRNALDPKLALEQCERAYARLQAELPTVDILRGKMNLEVRSRLVNKGQVVQGIQRQTKADLVVCAGDDRTDEDMFTALEQEPAYCIFIGPQERETVAHWYLPSPETLVDYLGHL